MKYAGDKLTESVVVFNGDVLTDLGDWFLVTNALRRAYAEANEAGLSLILRLAAEHRIDCDIERKAAITYTLDEKERIRWGPIGVCGRRLRVATETLVPVSRAVAPKSRCFCSSVFRYCSSVSNSLVMAARSISAFVWLVVFPCCFS